MFRWRRSGGRGGRSGGRGCCVVVPVGCLMSVMLIVLFSGLAVAKLL